MLKKLKQSIGIAIATTLLSSVGGFFAQPSYSSPNNNRYKCEINEGLPATVVYTPVDKIVLIRWKHEEFSPSGYTPMKRCQEVSGRFDTANRDKVNFPNGLKYITAGYRNGYPVICAATFGFGCNNGPILFTLRKGDDAAEKLEQLFDLKKYGSAAPALLESSGRVYIDINKLIESASNETNSTPSVTQDIPNQHRRLHPRQQVLGKSVVIF